MKLIATQTVTTAGPSITFSDIPQNFTDLCVLYSGRAASSNLVYLELNGSAANFSRRDLYGTGSTALSSSASDNFIGITGDAAHTGNVFGSMTLYIPNYTGSTAKSFSTDSVNENNATNADSRLLAGLWNNTAAITSLTIKAGGSTNIVAGSTVSLYGIGGAGEGYAAPKATGGVISYTPGYIVHTFASSGTFTPTTNLTNVEYLVVAGGGGGGYGSVSGGAGAGGLRTSVTGQASGGNSIAESKLSLTSGTAYTVTVGAGGVSGNGSQTSGSNSVFSTITSLGGSYGSRASTPGVTGGCGAGGTNATGPSSGTTAQGFGGGSGTTNTGGGGGGTGVVGGDHNGRYFGGNGGNGTQNNITGSSVYYGGGGGGSYEGPGTGGTGGLGGGGVGNEGSSGKPAGNGVANTGGGGGGANFSTSIGGNGGSGIVIVRYAA